MPPELDRVILRSLEPRPEDRYPTMEAFAKAAKAAVGEIAANERRMLGVHIEIGFLAKLPTEDDIDRADDLLEGVCGTLEGAGMSVAFALADTLLMTAPLPEADDARDVRRAELVSLALGVASDLRSDSRLAASVRVIVDSSESREHGARLDDPRTWDIPGNAGFLTCPRSLVDKLTETVEEAPEPGRDDIVRVTRPD